MAKHRSAVIEDQEDYGSAVEGAAACWKELRTARLRIAALDARADAAEDDAAAAQKSAEKLAGELKTAANALDLARAGQTAKDKEIDRLQSKADALKGELAAMKDIALKFEAAYNELAAKLGAVRLEIDGEGPRAKRLLSELRTPRQPSDEP